MSQTGTVVVTLRCEKDLHFMHKAAKALAMYNSVAVALELGTDRSFIDRIYPSAGIFDAECLITEKIILESREILIHHSQHLISCYIYLIRIKFKFYFFISIIFNKFFLFQRLVF
jgi:hypothetical protein